MKKKSSYVFKMRFRDTLVLNAREYWLRARRSLGYALVFAAITLLITFLVATLVLVFSSETSMGNSLKSNIVVVAGLDSPVRIDDEGVVANNGVRGGSDDAGVGGSGSAVQESGHLRSFETVVFACCLVEAFIVALLTMAFSGAFSAVFLSPINPIKFAPFAVLDRRGNRIVIRFWLCRKSGSYLHNVKISVACCHKGRYDASELDFGEGDAGPTATHLQESQFSEMLGVWWIVIPIGSTNSDRLYKHFEEHRRENPSIQVILQATTDSGEVVSRVVRYDIPRILPDYTHSLYHYMRVRGEDGYVEDVSGEGGNRKKSNFPAFYKVVAWSDVERMLASGRRPVNADVVTDPVDRSLFGADGLTYAQEALDHMRDKGAGSAYAAHGGGRALRFAGGRGGARASREASEPLGLPAPSEPSESCPDAGFECASHDDCSEGVTYADWHAMLSNLDPDEDERRAKLLLICRQPAVSSWDRRLTLRDWRVINSLDDIGRLTYPKRRWASLAKPD